MRVTTGCRRTHVFLVLVILGLMIWVPESVQAEKQLAAVGRCLAFQEDLTDPALGEFLGHRVVMPAGPVRTTYLSEGRKISQQTFIVSDGRKTLQATTTTCTGTCTGGCGVSGCDVTSSLGCSGCNCTGETCSGCTCTKTSTSTSASSQE
jgi:hypothetical protein